MIETFIYKSYYYSIILVLAFIWNTLSHIDILRMRQKLYIFGRLCSKLINNIIINSYLYEHIARFIIRPTYISLECIAAFLEGLGDIRFNTYPETIAQQELVVDNNVKQELVVDNNVKQELAVDNSVKQELVVDNNVKQELVSNNTSEPYISIINALDNNSDSNSDDASNYDNNLNSEHVNIESDNDSKSTSMRNVVSNQENTVTRKKINVKLARSRVNKNV